eukprot:g7372.t1
MGVIPRMVWSIFDGIDHAADYIEFVVKVAIVEIYNERATRKHLRLSHPCVFSGTAGIRDLLDPKKDNLKIHEDKAKGVFIGGVTETYVGSEQEIFDIMKTGKYNRAVAETNLNEHSSRSHLIFMLTIEQKNLHDRSLKVGKLHLVDLAGSEKVGKTGATGDRLDEAIHRMHDCMLHASAALIQAKNINRSLSALGNVINALTDRKSTHVPYRDSKLSRVLQESLGGNAKTSLIITTCILRSQETISTLRFGQRAKMIKNVVKVNHERSVEELKMLLQRRDQALGDLRGRVSLLEQLLRSNGIPVPEEHTTSSSLTRQACDVIDKLKEKSDQLAEANKEKDELAKQLHKAEGRAEVLEEEAVNAKQEFERMEYDKTEQVSELEKLRHEKTALQQELEERPWHLCAIRHGVFNLYKGERPNDRGFEQDLSKYDSSLSC